MKRLFAIALVLVLATCVFAGCTQKPVEEEYEVVVADAEFTVTDMDIEVSCASSSTMSYASYVILLENDTTHIAMEVNFTQYAQMEVGQVVSGKLLKDGFTNHTTFVFDDSDAQCHIYDYVIFK